MAVPASPEMICDPGPCDPDGLTVVVREMGLLPILVFAAAAFVAGRQSSRTNLLLPALCLMTIAAAFYVSIQEQLFLYRIGLPPGRLTSTDPLFQAFLREMLGDYAVGYLIVALAPFGGAIARNWLRQRKLKRSHVQTAQLQGAVEGKPISTASAD